MRRSIVGVMGPGEGATERDLQLAYQLGQEIGKAGWVLLTGGRNSGVMQAASQGAKSANGLTVGILPDRTADYASGAIDIVIVTDMGSARNNINVLSSDVVIACGMGAGTASEVALALKAGKPVILLNTSRESQQFFQQFATSVHVADTVAETIATVTQLLMSSPQHHP